MASYSRGSVVRLTVAAALSMAIFFTLYSLIPVTHADEPALSSLVVGTMMSCVMGVQPFVPAIVRAISLRYTMLVSSALLAVGAMTTGWATHTLLLETGAVAGGLGFGTMVVAGSQGVALLVSAQRLGQTLGVYGLVTMAATAVGSPVGVQLAVAFSPRAFGWGALAAGVVAVGFSFGIPRGVGSVGSGEAKPGSQPPGQTQPDGGNADDPDVVIRSGSLADAPDGDSPGRLAHIPWLPLGLLLVSVILLSHGLTGLPVAASAFGSAAVVVFAVQAGNAVGRGAGGQMQARLAARATTVIGALAAVVGGALGVLSADMPLVIVAGVLIGVGVGIVQTSTLHTAMQRMNPGRASVVWNLSVDGGLWAGGIIWGLALGAGLVTPGVLVVVALVLIAAVVAR